MKLITALFFSMLPVTFLQAQTQVYDVASIPKELLPYASAVVRSAEYTTEIKDLDNTWYHVKHVVTVLNKNGDDNAEIVLPYNKIDQIKYIRGIIYDQYGKPISKFKESDFQDFGADNNNTLFDDSRMKEYKPAVTEYPYTIEYECDIRSKETLGFFNWRPSFDYGTAVESSTYSIVCKPDFKLRFKEFNYTGKTMPVSNAAGLTTYTWKVSHLKAVKKEPLSPDDEQYLPVVRFAPEKFSYYGHNGAFTNWNELGRWVYNDLLSKRTELPPETVLQMQEMVKGITDNKLKAKKIYEYMQQKTRYVSVQVGIGGLQPFPASDVDKLSYGDCKALVNYTQALLKAVNIDSWYCVVKSGSRKKSFLPDFASIDQGDHVILCLPLKNDTTWLECTSKSIPFGYLGKFTDDRNVLACTPQGGKLLHTPRYTAADNRQICHADFVIDTLGKLDGHVQTTFEGTDYDEQEYFAEENHTDQVKDVKKYYGIDNMEIENLEFKLDKKQQPVTRQDLSIKANGYAASNSGKLYFFANATNRMGNSNIPKEVRNRITDVYINRGYTDVDEVTYTIPGGYKLDNFPVNVKLSQPFGNYEASLQQQGNKLIYKRRLEIKDGTYKKDLYQAVVDFYSAVVEADNQNAALIKN